MSNKGHLLLSMKNITRSGTTHCGSVPDPCPFSPIVSPVSGIVKGQDQKLKQINDLTDFCPLQESFILALLAGSLDQ